MYVRTYLKSIADFLTTIRFFIGTIFIYLGFYVGKKAFPFTIFLTILGWLSDVLDGALARASKVKYKTFIGEHDFHVDFIFSFSLLIYLVLSGFVSFIIIFIYLITAYLERKSFPEKEINSFLAIPYAFTIYNALRYFLPLGLMIIIFLIFLLIFSWNRFVSDKFPGFIDEIKSIWKK
jgi:hypothetical protein